MILNTAQAPIDGILITQIHEHKCCEESQVRWEYVSPTPMLENNGLTPTKLQDILQGINADIKRTIEDNYNRMYSKLAFLYWFVWWDLYGSARDTARGLPLFWDLCAFAVVDLASWPQWLSRPKNTTTPTKWG